MPVPPLRGGSTGRFGVSPIAARDNRSRLWAPGTAPARRVFGRSESGARMPDNVANLEEQAAGIFQQMVDEARALGVTEIEAVIAGETQALTRFANNAIHQNVSERVVSLSVRPVIDGRTARASTNRVDRDGIREVVGQAI